MKAKVLTVLVICLCMIAVIEQVSRRRRAADGPSAQRTVETVDARTNSVGVRQSQQLSPTLEIQVPTKAERLRMNRLRRLALLERLGKVPDDPDMSDFLIAAYTTWWGKRLDPATFWTNRVVWYDDAAEFEARRRGRGYPPMPYDDPLVADRSDEDKQSDGVSIESLNPRYVSSEREAVFWNLFVVTHPRPPQLIQGWIAKDADSWLRTQYMMEYEPEKAMRFKVNPKSLSEKLEYDLEDAKIAGYPPETVNSTAYYWDHVMRKRKEYKALMDGTGANSKISQDNFWGGVYVDRSLITEPLTPEQIRVANAWKVTYLKRLRAEKWDESYIAAYKKAWGLSEGDLAEPTANPP